MPPANDEIPNATVITTGVTNIAGTNVDATASAQEIAEGYVVKSVWYRIEIGANDTDLRITLDAGLTQDYNAELYLPLVSNPADFSDITDGFTFNTFVGSLGGPGEDEFTTPVLAGEVYYLSIQGDFTEEEFTFDLEVLNPTVCIYDAADGANLSSSTVSLTPDTPDWVRDVQCRSDTYVDGIEWKGDWDYTPSFEITVDCPASRYRVEILTRFDGTSLGAGQQMRVLKNGKPYGGFFTSGFGVTDGVEYWLWLSQETYFDRDFSGVLKDFGGPLYYDLSPGDVLTFCFGGWDTEVPGVAAQMMEVQQVKLVETTSDAKAPQWRIGNDGLDDQETWTAWDLTTHDVVKSRGSIIYLLSTWFIDPLGVGSNNRALNIITFEVNGDGIDPLSGDDGLTQDGSGEMEDLIELIDPGHSPGNTEVWGKDFTVMPNGDIYLVIGYDFTGIGGNHTVAMFHYDESGGSWSLIDGAIRSNDPTGRRVTSVSVDNDGTDVYFTVGEARQTSAPLGFWWRCWHYDVSGNTFTELGSGQNAFPGNPATRTVDAEYDRGVKLTCSPAGVPWVFFSSYDNPSPLVNYEEHAYAWYWDGSAWQDSGLPDPTILPLSDGMFPPHDYVLANGNSRNYVKFAVYGFYQVDGTFCHHDGPSEYPAVIYQYVFDDKTPSSPIWDASGFSYWEYDGANWGNEVWLAEGDAAGGGNLHGRDEPFENHFVQALHNINGDISRAHGWTQGFSLDNDGSVPYLMSQKGYGSSFVDFVYAAKMRPDGTAWEPVGQGFPDLEGSPVDGSGWSDVTTNAGTIVNGRPVCCWRNNNSFDQGLVLALFLPAGGVVSMNWRSGERNANSKRILVRG